MGWQPALISLLGFGAAATSLSLAVLAWRFRREPGAWSFLALMVALGGWSTFYGVQLGYSTGAEQLLWQRLGLAVGGTIPTLWVLFTIRYAGRDDWLSRGRLGLLAIDPVLFAGLTLSNPLHGLVWSGVTFVPSGPTQVVQLEMGPAYAVHIVYAYLLVAAGLAILLSVLYRATTLYRKQTGLLILGALPPFAANLAFTLGMLGGSLPALDLTPFAFAITGIAFGLALFQFDLLERVPVARERMIEEMGDGLVVLDPDWTVVSSNPIARQVLNPAPTVGDSITRTFADLSGGDDLNNLQGTTVSAELDGAERTYDVSVSMLTDLRGDTAGYLIALRDATARHAYEQRLEVANRVLRHNLRNDMNVVHGLATQIESETTGDTAGHAQRIVRIAEDLIDLGEKARTMVTTSDIVSATTSAVEVTEAAESVLGDFREEFPGIEFTLVSDGEVWVAIPDEQLLTIALSNLIENAIEHNDSREPSVRVSISNPAAPGERVTIRIADNGPGIPEMERDVLQAGSETPLEHGSGIGLWLVHWCIRAAGGEVAFESTDSDGSVVRIELDRADRNLPREGELSPADHM